MKKILLGIESFKLDGAGENKKKDARRSVSTNFGQPITSYTDRGASVGAIQTA